MATRSELQQAVNETTNAATTARTTWKDAIPGPDEPKMTDDEQEEVDVLEEAYTRAKATRKAAEQALADFDTAEIARKAATAAAAAIAPVASVAPVTPLDAEIEEAWKQQAKRSGYPSRPRPTGWNPF